MKYEVEVYITEKVERNHTLKFKVESCCEDVENDIEGILSNVTEKGDYTVNDIIKSIKSDKKALGVTFVQDEVRLGDAEITDYSY